MVQQQKRQQGRRPANNRPVEKPKPFYDFFRYDDSESVFNPQTGKVGPRFKATPAREIVRRLTCDKVRELMMFDRERTPAKTDQGRTFSIMRWSDKQQYAAWRYVAELCYGPLDKLPRWLVKKYGLGQHADVSVLTDFQIRGIHQIFLYVVAYEMQTVTSRRDGKEVTVARSLAAERLDDAYLPVAVEAEPDWYVEGIEGALATIENKQVSNGHYGIAIELWLQNVRAQELKALKTELKDQRAAEVDQQVDVKEEERRPLTDEEIKAFIESAQSSAS